jgi:hypothetical protein
MQFEKLGYSMRQRVIGNCTSKNTGEGCPSPGQLTASLFVTLQLLAWFHDSEDYQQRK